MGLHCAAKLGLEYFVIEKELENIKLSRNKEAVIMHFIFIYKEKYNNIILEMKMQKD